MSLTKDLNEHKVIILVGPTAVGKTGLSVMAARELNWEIVSADSRQVYRYMDIGTAKPTPEEMGQVKHHFIDVRTPDEYYSAGEFGREARICIRNILSQGKIPLVVGGSGFYLQALVDGLYAPMISDSGVKEKWRQKIIESGIESVFEKLRQVDPVSAARLHPNDSQRIVRALEVYDLTGSPISEYKSGTEKPAEFTPVFIGLNYDRARLYKRIEQRVDGMLSAGLLDEVKLLQEKGFGPELNALKTVGYQEVFEYFDKKLNYNEMVDKIKMNSRRYAKRQLTWFRRDERIIWYDPEIYSIKEMIRVFSAFYKSQV